MEERVIMSNAIGMVEFQSMTFAIDAADRMLKTARVKLEKFEKTGGGYVTVIVSGDVAAVQAALAAGGTNHVAIKLIPNIMNEVREKILNG